MSSAKKITLKSSDGELFEVEEAVAAMFPFFNQTAHKNSISTLITIGEVTGKILAKVIEYCKKQADTAAGEADSIESLQKWEADFVNVEMGTLWDLRSAADIFKIESLKDLVKEKLEEEEEKIFRMNMMLGLRGRKRKF